jgi:hypothetical protein
MRERFEEKEVNEEELLAQSADLLELRFLNKDNAVFSRTSGGFVALDYAGKHYDRVGVYRTFPLTQPDEFISIREADEKAREIGMVEKLTDLSKEAAQMLEEQLRLRYFMPVIEKIISVKDEYGYAYFEVKTNFGTCRFTTHMGSEAFVSLTESRILITDLDGNRYEIPDLNRLSAVERKKLDLFI